jgi:DNA-binding response OmpR family regulator
MQERKKVLIIDDEVDLSILLQSYLTRKGYEVHITHSVTDGLVKLKELEPSILFLDNNLPDGIGWEIAPQIAEDHKNIFICLLSAYHPAQPDMKGNTNYIIIEKPVGIADIEKHLVQHHL